MRQRGLTERGDDLAERDAAVVRRNALVPIGAKTFFLQTLDGTLRQATVLKAAAGQDDSLLADPLRNSNDGLGQSIVKAGGDLGEGKVPFQVGEDGFDYGGPIEEERTMLRGA
jgi:hypothetical protein